MQAAGPRNPSYTNPTQSSQRKSSIARPTVNTALDGSNSAVADSNSPFSGSATTGNYRPRQQRAPSATQIPSASSSVGRSFEKPSPRSTSNPPLNSPRSQPVLEFGSTQRNGVRDLVAKFNSPGSSPSGLNPTIKNPRSASASAGGRARTPVHQKPSSPAGARNLLIKQPGQTPSASQSAQSSFQSNTSAKSGTSKRDLSQIPGHQRRADEQVPPPVEHQMRPLFGEIVGSKRMPLFGEVVDGMVYLPGVSQERKMEVYGDAYDPVRHRAADPNEYDSSQASEAEEHSTKNSHLFGEMVNGIPYAYGMSKSRAEALDMAPVAAVGGSATASDIQRSTTPTPHIRPRQNSDSSIVSRGRRRVSESSMRRPNAMFNRSRSRSQLGAGVPAAVRGLYSEKASASHIPRPQLHNRQRSDPYAAVLPVRAVPNDLSSSGQGSLNTTTFSNAGQGAAHPRTPSPKKLKAIIKAPPLKKSPPLRSSRPRQQISAARSFSPTSKPSGNDELAADAFQARQAETGLPTGASPKEFAKNPQMQSDMNPNPPIPGAFPSSLPVSADSTPMSKDEPLWRSLDKLQHPTYHQKTAPLLKLDVPEQAKSGNDLNTGQTVFEEDDTPLERFATPSERFADTSLPLTAENIAARQTVEENSLNRDTTSRSRTVLSQILEMRKRETYQPNKANPSIFGSDDAATDAGTIQILLSNTPALNRQSQGWQNHNPHRTPPRPIHQLSARYPHDSVGSGLRQSDNAVDDTFEDGDGNTLDSDAYSVIHRVLDQYRQSGYITPAMIQEFQHSIVETDPDFRTDDADSAYIVKAVLEDIIRDHNAPTEVAKTESGVDPSRPSGTRTGGTMLLSPSPDPHDRDRTPRPISSSGSVLMPFTYQPGKESASGVLPQTSYVAATSNLSPAKSSSKVAPFAGTHEVRPKVNTTIPRKAAQIMGISPSIPMRGGSLQQDQDEEWSTPNSRESLPAADAQQSPPNSATESPAAVAPSATITTPAREMVFPILDNVVAEDSSFVEASDSAVSNGHQTKIDSGSLHSNTTSFQTSSGSQEDTLVDSSRNLSFEDRRVSQYSSHPSDGSDQGNQAEATTPNQVKYDTPATSASRSERSQGNSRTNESTDANSFSSSLSPDAEQTRLKRRRHGIKELIDTEFSFNQDMKIVDSIYKETFPNDLDAEDKRVLFGNNSEIVAFSERLLDALKKAAKSVYAMPRSQKWRMKQASFSSSKDSQSDQASGGQSELSDEEKDRQTYIGEVFKEYAFDMEKVYSEYLKNHDFANQRLARLQKQPNVKLWLNECQNYAKDLTTAWDLDSLLVKPVQRMLKYPLLLQGLLDATPEGHPDRHALEDSVKQMTDISHRINEAKKRADLLDRVVNGSAKREPALPFSKAFGRRTEKLRQQVGLTEAVEDPEYKNISEKFGGRYLELQVVMRDMEEYLRRSERFMQMMNSYVEGVEGWIALGHSSHPEVESKWRKFAMIIRQLSAIQFPEHERVVRIHCLEPMVKVLSQRENLQTVMGKRKKRLVEYAKYIAIKNRGDKPDKKTREQGEEFMALNESLKEELPKFYSLMGRLAEACLKNFIDLQAQWLMIWQGKMRQVIDDGQQSHTIEEIVEGFKADYSWAATQASSLSICNGSFMHDIANFLSPSFRTDESSSMKRPSVQSRSTASTSEQSPNASQTEFHRRSGSGYNVPTFSSSRSSSDIPKNQQSGNGYLPPQSQAHRQRGESNPGIPPYASRQAGAQAQAGAPYPTTRSSAPYMPGPYNPAAYGPYGQPSFSSSIPRSMPGPAQNANRSGPPMTGGPSNQYHRPESMQTFYSAAQHIQTSPNPQGHQPIFSSAMPPSDSPLGSRSGSPSPSTQRHRSESQSLLGGGSGFRVLFLAASLFEFNIDRNRTHAGYRYLTYVPGEIFDVLGEKGELWLARNQDDASGEIGWIWEKHFARLLGEEES